MAKSRKYEKLFSAAIFAENTLALTALCALISLTIFTYIVINPKVGQNLQVGEVAGVTTDEQAIEIKDLYYHRRHEASFVQEQNNLVYHITPKSMPQGELIVDLAEINNQTSNELNYKASVEIKGYVLDILDIYINDGINDYKVFDSYSGQTLQTINLKPAENIKLTLKYDALEKINFPFEIKLVLTAN